MPQKGFCFREDGADNPLPYTLAGTTKTSGYYIQNKQNSERWREKADQLGITGPEGRHDGEFPVFLFCLVYPKFGVKEANNLEMSTDMDQNNPDKNLLFLVIATGKEHPCVTKNI